MHLNHFSKGGAGINFIENLCLTPWKWLRRSLQLCQEKYFIQKLQNQENNSFYNLNCLNMCLFNILLSFEPPGSSPLKMWINLLLVCGRSGRSVLG